MSPTTPIQEQVAANGAKECPPLAPTDQFIGRHIGPSDSDVAEMLKALGYDTLDAMSDAAVPEPIRLRKELKLGEPRGEHELLDELRAIANRNKFLRSFIGQGYSGTITPAVILRNILENPGWYTQYTPYQPEISQGRLEALLTYQTMISDLTALPLANASLLDEGTAAAEAMAMCRSIVLERDESTTAVFFVAQDCHPQTIAVVKTRAKSLGIEVVVGHPGKFEPGNMDSKGEDKGTRRQGEKEKGEHRLAADATSQSRRLVGVLLQYPTTDGRIEDYSSLISRTHAAGAMVVMSADLLALALITPPGELGADIAIGSAQRFGVPMGFGGPHAAFMATRTEYARKMPGRIIGVSKDADGQPALRLALQTREQHIRREKATSNICTAQVLLAIMAGMYAVYHGPRGLKSITTKIHTATAMLAEGLKRLGHDVGSKPFFDTLRVRLDAKCGFESSDVLDNALKKGINLRAYADGSIGVSLDETVTRQDLESILQAFNNVDALPFGMEDLGAEDKETRRQGDKERGNPSALLRQSPFLTHPVFNSYHSETEMLRYIFRLQSRDLSLAHAMIPLGSCTMKLNATSEMIPVTWPQFAELHPFVPADQARGYQKLFKDLERWLAEITGFAAVSLQPNAGSQGEYSGLLVIRAYHESRGQGHRNICLIPTSAHGTNPASAVIAGFKTVPVACDAQGNIDIDDLRAKAKANEANLACLMVTYPSTHGVFEEGIKEICKIVHDAGGQVYMDGANMNAQVGLCRPGDIGADVCHLNLHKTFCIPHGGGGPGMGPIAVDRHLKAFLPALTPEGSGAEDKETRGQADKEKGSTKARRHEGTKGEGATQSAIGNRPSAITQDSALSTQDSARVGMVSSSPYGSASILPISWMYIGMMGSAGLRKATQVAILNANYVARRLESHYPVLYRGKNGLCAHECILDCREFEHTAGVKVEDIAKRLMDYGFHAPTMSWPVPGTLMVEPTESESKAELDRFIEAMIQIRQEIKAIEEGRMDRQDNPLKNAPHTASAVSADAWPHKYSRELAAYPTKWARHNKFWPAVARVDNPYGDRNLVCACPPVQEWEYRRSVSASALVDVE